MVIIDVDTETERALELVSHLSNDRITKLMVYSAQANPELMLRSLRLGAHDFLNVPLADGEMAGAITRAAARRRTSSQQNDNVGKLYVFFGVKGGVGVTLLATNYALLLARESGKKTLLIDLDLPLGDIAVNLGLTGKYSTVDSLQNASRLDTNFLSSLLQEYQGLSVLAAPGQFVNVTTDKGAIDKLIAVARRQFDYVVVDSGSRLNFIETDLYNDAASIYMVLQTGIPELRNANRLVGQFPKNGDRKLQIVANRYTDSFHAMDVHTINAALGRPVDWKIPNDFRTAFRTQSTATPLALEDSPNLQNPAADGEICLRYTGGPEKKAQDFRDISVEMRSDGAGQGHRRVRCTSRRSWTTSLTCAFGYFAEACPLANAGRRRVPARSCSIHMKNNGVAFTNTKVQHYRLSGRVVPLSDD